jgi:DNA ligase-4
VLQVDELLDELASWSKYTYRPLRNAYATRTRSSVQQVMADLFENTTPFEAAVLVQVVLKDLRPLIYPLATTDTFASLVNFKSNAIKPLELHQAIKLWDPSGVMERALSARSSIEAASDVLESGLQDVEPVVGMYIQV